MSVQERRARERAERGRRIIEAARDLAEREGWEAVTTRRLSEAIEYSQPVLYSHFPDGKAGIAAAMALDAFAELAQAIRDRRGSARSPRTLLTRLADAYLDFAEASPAMYQVMFAAPTTLLWADESTPAPMQDCFAEIVESVGPVTGDDAPGTLAEVVWSALHGLATLTRDGRLPPRFRAARTRVLVDRLVGGAAS